MKKKLSKVFYKKYSNIIGKISFICSRKENTVKFCLAFCFRTPLLRHISSPLLYFNQQLSAIAFVRFLYIPEYNTSCWSTFVDPKFIAVKFCTIDDEVEKQQEIHVHVHTYTPIFRSYICGLYLVIDSLILINLVFTHLHYSKD